MSYIIRAQSGAEIESKAKTLVGAKREASAWITHGGGTVYVLDAERNPICYRRMWSEGHRFGWLRWEAINA